MLPFNAFAYDKDIYSNNVLLYNLKEDKILYEKNINEEIKIASLTKVITVLVALENIKDLNEKVTLNNDVFTGLYEAGASMAGFKPGDTPTYKDLLYGAMLPSGADATSALAINLFGSEDKFVNKMNDLAQNLKLKNTFFTNTSGLDETGQKTTLNDFLTIMKYALNNNDFKDIFKSDTYITESGLKFTSNLNYLGNRYNVDTSNIIGSKTGYTNLAGLCLVSLSIKDDLLLITAGAHAPNDYIPLHIVDANNIYNYYFDNYSYKNILSSNDVITKSNFKYYKNNDLVYKGDSINYYALNSSDIKIDYNINNNYFSKNKGTFNVYLEGDLILSDNLYLNDSFSPLLFLKYNYLYILGLLFILFIFKKKA